MTWRKFKSAFIVELDSGLPLISADGGVWRGGSPSLVGVPVFYKKQNAQAFRRKAKRQLKANWSKVHNLWSVIK